MARRFQAYPKNAAKHFVAQAWRSGPPHIYSPVEGDGLRFDTARVFYSPANFWMPPLITNMWYHSTHATLERFILLHSKHISFLPECFESVAASNHRVSCFRHWTLRCRCSSSCLASAKIWIDSWSVCEDCHSNAITVMLRVNLSIGWRCAPHAHCRCTALGDKSPHIPAFWLRTMSGPYICKIPKWLCRSGSIIKLPLERVNLKRQHLLGDSADDWPIPLTCLTHFLE